MRGAAFVRSNKYTRSYTHTHTHTNDIWGQDRSTCGDEGGDPKAAPCSHTVVLEGRNPNLTTWAGGHHTNTYTHTHTQNARSLMRRRCAQLGGAGHSRTTGRGSEDCVVLIVLAGFFSVFPFRCLSLDSTTITNIHSNIYTYSPSSCEQMYIHHFRIWLTGSASFLLWGKQSVMQHTLQTGCKKVSCQFTSGSILNFRCPSSSSSQRQWLHSG